MSQVTGAPPQPSRTIIPAASVAEVQDVLRECGSRGEALRVAGAGHWLDAGRPVDAAVTLSVRMLRGIVEYVPGDLTLTAWAGTTLAELDDVVAEYGQWIALDPGGVRHGTLGATVATASNGPLAASFGTPRDVVLGVQCVTGDGDMVQGGARVVKHVAGFDIVRLMTGSWGTLGVLTQLTLRLRARAPVDVSYAVALGAAPLAEWFAAYRQASVTALAAEVLNADTAHALGVNDGPVVLVRLAGNDAAVTAQEAALRQLGDVRDVSRDVWSRLAATDPAAPGAALRISRRTADAPALWDAALALTRDLAGARVHATLDRGVARVVIPQADDDLIAERLRESAAQPGSRVYEVLPRALWPLLSPSAVTDALSTRIRAAFDPQRVLNRGILGET